MKKNQGKYFYKGKRQDVLDFARLHSSLQKKKRRNLNSTVHRKSKPTPRPSPAIYTYCFSDLSLHRGIVPLTFTLSENLFELISSIFKKFIFFSKFGSSLDQTVKFHIWAFMFGCRERGNFKRRKVGFKADEERIKREY